VNTSNTSASPGHSSFHRRGIILCRRCRA